MRITTKLLKKYDACEDQVDLFDSLFPDGAEVTEATCLKANASNIDFDWACQHLLKDQKVYEATRKPFLDAYRAAKKPSMDAYVSAVNSFYILSIPVIESRSIYFSIMRRSLQEYRKQQALLFSKQFNEENP